MKLLTDVDLDLLRLRFFRLRQRDGEDAVLVARIHFVRVDAGRQRDAAAEFAGKPFRARGAFAVAFAVAAVFTLGGAFAWCLGVPALERVDFAT